METREKYVLVTGGAGFIGSHTVVSLCEKGFIPIILDDFRNAHPDVIDRLEMVTGQKIIHYPFACQENEKVRTIFSDYPIAGVIHFAAYKAVAESIEKPMEYIRNNIESLLAILKFVEEFEVKKFVFSSSCTVYGNPAVIPVEETFPTTYLTPYGFSKKSGEEILEQFVEKYPTTEVTILRYFNPIGAHKSGLIGEEPDGKPNNLLPYITQTAVGKREKLTIFGKDYPTPDGTCVRDYIHVVDLARAHVMAYNAKRGDENPAVYNVGTGEGKSVLEIVQLFERISGKKVPYQFGERREGDIPKIFAKADKINKKLGWKSELTVEEAIASSWKFEQYILTKR